MCADIWWICTERILGATEGVEIEEDREGEMRYLHGLNRILTEFERKLTFYGRIHRLARRQAHLSASLSLTLLRRGTLVIYY